VAFALSQGLSGAAANQIYLEMHMSGLSLKKLFCGLLALLIPCSIAMWHIDAGLRNTTTPNGIVSFEFCAYTDSCHAALMAWGAEGQSLAMLSLGLDYLFMLLYPGFICVCLLLLARQLTPRLKQVTTFAAWIALAAGVADAIENYALIQIVLNQTDTYYGWLAALFATIKFSILGITLPWLIVAIALAMRGRKAS